MTESHSHPGPYETCYACRGSGVQLGIGGDIATCSKCHGDCVLLRRDGQGRFVR